MISLPPRSSSRLPVLAAMVIAAVFLPVGLLRVAIPALSVFLGISTAVATRAVGLTLLCALPMLALTLRRRRWFCHYCCPTGWLVEACGQVRPGARCDYARVPALGQWAALLTIAGAALSFPVLLVLDPIAMISGAAGALRPPISWPGSAYATGLGAVLLLSLLFPLLWCRRLCPLGGLQDLLADLRHAVSARLARKTVEPDGSGLARRAFVCIGTGAALGLLAGRSRGVSATDRLRPPGTVDETALSALCVRCGNCVRACPTGIIQADLWPADFTGFLAPVIRFDEGHCRDDCARCGAFCPTGAIAALPLAAKNERKIGIARIEHNGCLLRYERECGVCAIVCRREAILSEFSRETYTVMVRVDEDRCNGCGECLPVCPPRVITITKAP